MGTVSRVLGYLLVIGLVAAIITFVAVAFLQPRWQAEAAAAEAQEMSFRSVVDGVRSAFGYPRGQGVVLGRAVAGIDPPSIAERLAAVSAAASSQHTVTPGQEVVMTGSGTSLCLGADNEVMLEVQNDIGADQIDISYAFENLVSTGEIADPIPARPIKVASCGPRSVIKQCIPLPPTGRGVRLHTLAYYYMSAAESSETHPKISSSVREETRIYPSLFDSVTLKSGKVELVASTFVPSSIDA